MSYKQISVSNGVLNGKFLVPGSIWSVLMNLQVLVQKANNARVRCGHNIQILQYSATNVSFVCHNCSPKLSNSIVKENKDKFTQDDSLISNNYSDKLPADNSSDDSVDKLLIDDSTDDSVEIVDIDPGDEDVDKAKNFVASENLEFLSKVFGGKNKFYRNEDSNSYRLSSQRSLDDSTDIAELESNGGHDDTHDNEKEVEIRDIDGDNMPIPNNDLEKIIDNHSDKHLRSLNTETDQNSSIITNVEMETCTDILDLLYPEVKIKEHIENESVLSVNKEVKDTSDIIREQTICLLKLRPLAELQRPIPYINQTCATVVNSDPGKNRKDLSIEQVEGNPLVQPPHLDQLQTISSTSDYSTVPSQMYNTINTNNTPSGLPNIICPTTSTSDLEQMSEKVVTQGVKSLQAGRATPQSRQLESNIKDSVHMRQQVAISSKNSMLSSSSQLRSANNLLMNTGLNWNNTVSTTSTLFSQQQIPSKSVPVSAAQNLAPIATVRNGRIRKNYSKPGFASGNAQSIIQRNLVEKPVRVSLLQNRPLVRPRSLSPVILQQRPGNPVVKSQLWNAPSFEQVRGVGPFNNVHLSTSQPPRVWQSQINHPAPQGLNQSVQYPGLQNVNQYPTGVQNLPQHSRGVQNIPQHSRGVQNIPQHSRGVQNIPQHSRGVQNIPQHSRGVQNIPQPSRASQNMSAHQFSVRSELVNLVKQIEGNKPNSKK